MVLISSAYERYGPTKCQIGYITPNRRTGIYFKFDLSNNIFPLVRAFLLVVALNEFQVLLVFNLMTLLRVRIIIGIGVQAPKFSLDYPRMRCKDFKDSRIS
jgi:hypothetical protein